MIVDNGDGTSTYVPDVEWPAFEDGAPVLIGSMVDDGSGLALPVDSIQFSKTMYHIGYFYGEEKAYVSGSYGKPVRGATPDSLDRIAKDMLVPAHAYCSRRRLQRSDAQKAKDEDIARRIEAVERCLEG